MRNSDIREKSIDTGETFTLEHIAVLFYEIDKNGVDSITLKATHTRLNCSFFFSNTINGRKYVTDSIRLYSALVV